MKKIAFSLLIIGLALPMLSLAQDMNVYKSAAGQVAPTTNVQIKAELQEKEKSTQSSDVYKLISPMMPTIAPIAPMINKIIAPESASGGGSSASGASTRINPATPSIMPVPNAALPACYIGDDLMKQYDTLISELQDTQKKNDLERGNLVTQKIIELKKEISASKTNCGGGSATSVTKPQSSIAPEVKKGVISSGTVEMSKCEEVKRWEEKIAYYTKINDLADSDLKNQTNLSRDEIKNILVSLTEGLQKIREQCNNVQTTATGTAASVQAASEPIKPVGVQSVQEIQSYYKAKIETITNTQNASEQVQQLKALKNDKDQLVGELIKNNKEIQASDLNAVAKEIKINKNEIMVDDVSVKMTGSRILLNVGNSSISVVSTGNKVIIKDKNFEVSADGVSISDNSLKIGGVEVKLVASDVAEKLNVAPNAVELTTENSQPVYKMKVAEQRKLFGFIKMDVQNTQTADANNGNLLSESKPWYYFLTTK